jgi:hypothetical protein
MNAVRCISRQICRLVSGASLPKGSRRNLAPKSDGDRVAERHRITAQRVIAGWYLARHCLKVGSRRNLAPKKWWRAGGGGQSVHGCCGRTFTALRLDYPPALMDKEKASRSDTLLRGRQAAAGWYLARHCHKARRRAHHAPKMHAASCVQPFRAASSFLSCSTSFSSAIIFNSRPTTASSNLSSSLSFSCKLASEAR